MPISPANPARATFRRGHPRLKCRGIARIKPALAEQDSTGWLLDLSLGGCCIEWNEAAQCEIGSEVEMRLDVRGNVLWVRGVVRWVRRKKFAGVEFIHLSPRKQEQVKEMLADFVEMLRAAGAVKASRGTP